MVHNDPFGSPLFLDPQCYPHCFAAAVPKGFFLATRQLSAIITFRLIALGPPSERDRQGQIGRVPKPLPASRRAKRILVPAAVATVENVRGGLAPRDAAQRCPFRSTGSITGFSYCYLYLVTIRLVGFLGWVACSKDLSVSYP